MYAYLTSDGGLTWSEVQKLLASDAASSSFFGASLSISAEVLAVGSSVDDHLASNSGRWSPTYLAADSWILKQKFLFFEGSVYVFRTVDGGLSWSEAQKLVASDGAVNDYFGYVVSVSGDVLAVGSVFDDDKGESSGMRFNSLVVMMHE